MLKYLMPLLVALWAPIGGLHAQEIDPKQSLQFIEPTRITIHIPIDKSELYDPKDPSSVLATSEPLKSIIALLQRSAPIGRIANYDGVYELSVGFEGFTPASADRLDAGTNAIWNSAELVIYCEPEVLEADINAFLLEVLALHPWEYPMIEVANSDGIRLWTSKLEADPVN